MVFDGRQGGTSTVESRDRARGRTGQRCLSVTHLIMDESGEAGGGNYPPVLGGRGDEKSRHISSKSSSCI